MATSDGPTILVTGATDGIGLATARMLLARGARVIAHGRDSARLERVVDELRATYGDAVLQPVCGDFSRLSDVRSLASEIAHRDVSVDVLLNNAGVFMNREVRTDEGFETTWAVNHLAPFALTHLLLASKNPPRRVVFVSSDAHRHGRVSPDDPGGRTQPFDRVRSYCGSKLANVITTLELARRLAGRGITVDALHPGVVSTKLLTEGFGAQGPDSLETAAKTVAAVVLEADGGSGRYFEGGRALPTPTANDPTIARAFYAASAAAAGVPALPEP